VNKKYRITLTFESTGDEEVYPDDKFFQEQWEQTASAMEGDLIEIEKIEGMPYVGIKKL
jgi:hypothetical protein